MHFHLPPHANQTKLAKRVLSGFEQLQSFYEKPENQGRLRKEDMDMNRVNYQQILDKTIEQLQKEGRVPRLLLHSCCAPCSSYCLEYLSQYFRITVLYYNPNIFPKEEYDYRVSEQVRLVKSMESTHPIEVISTTYRPEEFYQAVQGLEKEAEGGLRCFACYELRLRETARIAKKESFDFFTTTLSISPLKKADKLNQIGAALSEEYGIPYLFSDFKKKGGYQRSVELSAEYGLYRQNFCGCVYSKLESEARLHAQKTFES